MAKLTPKQRKFVQEYLKDPNGTTAATKAGFSKKTASVIANQLLKKPWVASAIAKGQEKQAEKAAVTAEMIVAEYAKLGFSNMQDYMRVGADGDPVLNFADLTRDQAAALSEITVEDFKDGRGDEARDVRRVKFKLADKKAALDSLARHLGMFTDKSEVTHKGATLIINT